MDELISAHLLLSESEFLTEVAANTPALAINTETGRIIHANAEAERLFDCQVKNGLTGLPFERLIPSELREKHARHVAAYAKNPHPRAMGAQLKLRAVTLTGGSFPVAITLRPIQKLDRLYVILTFLQLPEDT